MEFWSSCFEELSAEPAEGPPTLRSGASRMLTSLMLRMKKFLVFKYIQNVK